LVGEIVSSSPLHPYAVTAKARAKHRPETVI
jgi:hypothetical protein